MQYIIQINIKMKQVKILFTATILFFFMGLSSSQAQGNEDTNRARIGIKGGVNFSALYTKDADKSKMQTGFNLGLFSKLPITNYLAIQPELYFTTKGAEVTYNDVFVDGTAEFKLNYVELPLMIVVNISDNFNLQVGPYAALLVSGKVKNGSNINLFDFEENINPEDYNKLDAGVAAGAGIDIGAVSIGARYNVGLTTVGKERTFLGTPYTFPNAKNSVLNFYIALGLN